MIFSIAVSFLLIGQNFNDTAETMIQSLASNCTEPTSSFLEKSSLAPRPGPDRDSQKIIYKAITSLVALKANSGLEILLAKSFSDHRYSVTEDEFGNGLNNLTVGLVCQEILKRRLEVYRDILNRDGDDAEVELRHPRQQYVTEVIARKPDLWIREHQKSTLLELQIEATQWTLANERRLQSEKRVGCPEKVEAFLKELMSRREPFPPLEYEVFHRF